MAMKYRAEDKYICNEMEMRILQARVGAVLKADSNQNNDFGYKITSLYFDDIYDSCFKDTEAGNGIRQKYRIRVYNDSFEDIKLEVKYKRYNRVHKKTSIINVDQMNQLIQGKCIYDEKPSVNSSITLFNAAISQRGLKPRVIVEYDRKAYIFQSGNVRITFERNVRACPDVYKFGNDVMIFKKVSSDNNVLEVKYDEFLPGFIAQLVETGNMNQTSFSKYKICCECID